MCTCTIRREVQVYKCNYRNPHKIDGPELRQFGSIFSQLHCRTSNDMVLWKETCIVRFREAEYTQEDVQNSWYNDNELASFKAERLQMKRLVKEFGSAECLEKAMGDLYTCRGLEKFVSKSQKSKRKDNIQGALQAVLTIQQEFRVRSIPNTDKAICAAYRMISKECQKEANIMAFLTMAKDQHAEQLEATVVRPSKLAIATTKMDRMRSKSPPPLHSRSRVSTTNVVMPKRL